MKSSASLLLCLLPLVSITRVAIAQDMEPRRWTHLPVDLNIFGGIYTYTPGDLQFDPVLGIEDAKVEMHTAILTYNRSFAVLEKTARLDVQVPVQSGQWDGLVNGEPQSITREGLGDPRIRFSLNLAGAPALRGKEYLDYRRNNPVHTVAGVALAARLPIGEYLEDKLINLGDNRFAFETQAGVVHTNGPWSFELTGSVFLYTDNDEFFNGNTLEQDPLFAVQSHIVRTFDSGWWASAGVAYGTGGETTVNGVSNDDERRNLLWGASIGLPIRQSQSIQLGYIRREALADSGISSDNFYVGWSIRF